MQINCLQQKIVKKIINQGPISVFEYINISMNDPILGYYNHKNPIGKKGDFITSPEISQMFGEMIAIWIINSWKSIQEPENFVLCEIGPGTGTLMHDILRTIKKLKLKCFNSAHIFLFEKSQKMIEIQKTKLIYYGSRITWIKNFHNLPYFPIIIYNNEFFDVLPIHQYVFYKNLLFERMISIDQYKNLCFFIDKKNPIQWNLIKKNFSIQNRDTIFLYHLIFFFQFPIIQLLKFLLLGGR